MGLDTVETVLWAESNFEIRIPDEVASEIRTVGEFCTHIHQQIALKDSFKAKPKSQIFDEVKNYLVTQFKAKPERITQHAEFVKDLGLG